MPENAVKPTDAIRKTRKYMLDMLLLLCAPAVMAWYYYGSRALKLICVCVITAILTQITVSAIVKARSYISDLSAVFIAASIALCMPAYADWWLPCLAVIFAVTVAVIPFGGPENLLFSPAAAGLAFITICFPDKVFAYPVIPSAPENLPLLSSVGFIKGESISYMLSQGNSIGVNIINYIDILVGNVPGPMGATCAIAMLGGLVYLIFRRPKGAVISLSYLLTCAAFAAVFPRIGGGRLVSVIMELCGGFTLISALIFISDETVAPKRFISRVCYGVAAGLIAMLLRLYSPLEESSVFAVLLANGISPVFDSKIPVFGLEKKHMLNKIELAKEEQLKLKKELEDIEKAKKEQEEMAQINAALQPERSKFVRRISKNINRKTQLETKDIPEAAEDTAEEAPEDGYGDAVPVNPDTDPDDSDDIPTLQYIGELADKYELGSLDEPDRDGGACDE